MHFATVLACSSFAVPVIFCRSLSASPSLLSSSPVYSQCDGCLEYYVGAYGWVAGIVSYGSVILSRERLVTVEDPSFIQHDEVGENNFYGITCKSCKVGTMSRDLSSFYKNYGLLTKFEVKMAWYWPKLAKKKKTRTRPIPSHLYRTNLVYIEDLSYGF